MSKVTIKNTEGNPVLIQENETDAGVIIEAGEEEQFDTAEGKTFVISEVTKLDVEEESEAPYDTKNENAN